MNDHQFERLLERLESVDRHLHQAITVLLLIFAAVLFVGLGSCAIAGAL
ncbi:MAG: hypothetical protein ACREDF_00695 [Thermoplasmata archaeon]